MEKEVRRLQQLCIEKDNKIAELCKEVDGFNSKMSELRDKMQRMEKDNKNLRYRLNKKRKVISRMQVELEQSETSPRTILTMSSPHNKIPWPVLTPSDEEDDREELGGERRGSLTSILTISTVSSCKMQQKLESISVQTEKEPVVEVINRIENENDFKEKFVKRRDFNAAIRSYHETVALWDQMQWDQLWDQMRYEEYGELSKSLTENNWSEDATRTLRDEIKRLKHQALMNETSRSSSYRQRRWNYNKSSEKCSQN